MNNTKWLNETNLNKVNLVGGKNASLGSMMQNLQSLNIKVPNGFVITTDCYDYLKYNLSMLLNTIIQKKFVLSFRIRIFH